MPSKISVDINIVMEMDEGESCQEATVRLAEILDNSLNQYSPELQLNNFSRVYVIREDNCKNLNNKIIDLRRHLKWKEELKSI